MAEAPNRIRELRERRGLTQETLALLCAVGRRTVHSWEVGEKVPHPRNAKLLARRFGVTVEELGLPPRTAREQARDRRLGELLARQAQGARLTLRELREMQLLRQAVREAPVADDELGSRPAPRADVERQR